MGTLRQKVGFFGAGRMATALAKGMIHAGVCSPDQIMAGDVVPAILETFQKETGARTTASNVEVARFCDVAILAVKPNHVTEVLQSIRSDFSGKLLVSIAAGITVSRLEAGLESSSRVIRVMPNTPALVGSGASGYAGGKTASAGDLELANTILCAVGYATEVPESMLDAVTGLSGSGPAYLFLTIEAMAEGGVRMGLPRDIALQLAARTVLGAARMVLETGMEPKALKDMVTSPGGTTMEGLKVLEDSGVPAAFVDAIRAATEKSKKLAG